MKKVVLLLIFYLSCSIPSYSQSTEFTKENKPWTYWWWMGSAVTKEGITQHLEAFQKAGIGGVHIIPLYGAKDEEKKFLWYLSKEWIDAFAHTVKEAQRLGLGVDMTSGTGWPFGGPWVKKEDATKSFLIIKNPAPANVPVNKNLVDSYKDGKLISVLALDDHREGLDITSVIKEDGMLNWVSDKSYTLYIMYQKNVGQNVKRAAPGDEGLVMDVFSRKALDNYLYHFDSAFKANPSPMPRCFYNDSYEVYLANWTDNYFDEFKKRRGYDLRRFINIFADSSYDETSQRVWQDYHETISDMLLENYTLPWVKWANSKGCKARNQAHGSPGNLLDLYAAADIPETESFGSSNFKIPGLRMDTMYSTKQFGRPSPLYFKFASSASNVSGKKYTSSETCTWLADHFQVSLSQIKPQIDELFVSGINHIFFHGMTYSEFNKPFPGNLFYASTNFGPSSHFWNELPQLNTYIARCQNILQNTDPLNDILLYFPIYDIWTGAGNQQSKMLTVHEATGWFDATQFGETARLLNEKGYCFDYVSDKQIQQLNLDNISNILSGKNTYKMILVPPCKFMPLKTLKKLEILSRKGALIVFMDDVATHSPGLQDFAKKEKEMKSIAAYTKKLQLVYTSNDLIKTLTYLNILPEQMTDKGLAFIRKKKANGTIYFITNLKSSFYEGDIDLTAKAASLIYYDPMNEKKGTLFFKKTDKTIRFYVNLQPGQSCFIEASNSTSSLPAWNWYEKAGNGIELTGKWTIAFKEGGPVLPKKIKTKKLISWTELDGNAAKAFSGTANYFLTFDLPDAHSDCNYLLELGDVRETAVVTINNQLIGHSWCLPYNLQIPSGLLKTKGNKIEIAVTNLSINRVIDMDNKNISWKNFFDINFVNIKYQPYDAKTYPLAPSGLLGPVKLYSLKIR